MRGNFHVSLAILSSTIVLLLLKNSGHKVHWPVLGGDSFSLYETTHYLTPLILPLPLCCYSMQTASQVGALDVGYKAGITKEELKGIKFLYLLGEVRR